MNAPTCETCAYWREVGDTGTGECRRHAPPSRIGIPKIGDGFDKFYSCFPETYAEEWCGDHNDFPAWLAWLEARKANP